MFACVALLVLAFFATHCGFAQACACPEICNPCQGGVTEYGFQFNGEGQASVTVKDGAGNVLFDSKVYQGDIFFVEGSVPPNRFAGSKVIIALNGIDHVTITTTCVGTPAVNTAVGEFVVVRMRRGDGNLICCADTSLPDLVAPTFLSAPADIIVETTPGQCGALAEWAPPTVEDCNIQLLTSNIQSGSFFSTGETKVIYSGLDFAGNVTQRSFNVTVSDIEPPVITGCPEAIEVNTDNTEGMSVKWDSPTVTDNCIPQLNCSHEAGSVFPVGETIVTYEARDVAGNLATCQFTIRVNYNPPPEKAPLPPALPGPDDIRVPRIITPDGDGKNDFWQLFNIESYPDNQVVIVDRWGSTIFRATGYDNQRKVWKGESPSKGKLPAGTYYFIVTYVRGGIPAEQKGFIELIP